MGIIPPYSSSLFLGIEGAWVSFFPKLGSILRKTVTRKVMAQHAITMMKNMAVTHHVLQITRNHARKHQAEIGDARTDGIMGGLELALTVEQHVEGKNREAQTITELLDKQAGGNHDEVAVERIAQKDVDSIRQGDGANHWPQPLLHTVAAH